MTRDTRYRASSAGGIRVPFSVPVHTETRDYMHKYAEKLGVNTAEFVRLAIAEHCYKYGPRSKFPAELKEMLERYGLTKPS